MVVVTVAVVVAGAFGARVNGRWRGVLVTAVHHNVYPKNTSYGVQLDLPSPAH